MIVFNILCKDCNSEFEGWFDSSKEFDKQKRKNLINCPICDNFSIKKSLMTPNLPRRSNTKKIKNQKNAIANDIKKYKKIIEKNYDYVGDKFTEEAKKIKYGEIKERPIYGEASLEQTKELLEEEINIMPLPWSPSKKNN